MATRDSTGSSRAGSGQTSSGQASSGRAGAGFGPDIGQAFGAATRDYFEAMAHALRGVGGAPAAPADPWRAVFDAWSAAAGGRNGFGDSGFSRNPFAGNPFTQTPFGQGGFGQSAFGQSAFGQPTFGTPSFGDSLDAVVGRFAEQGRQWFGRMQALVERFSGGDAAPADIAQAWKSMLGGEAANPFADLFAQMGGRGHAGFDQWFAQVAPLLRAGWADAWAREGSEWLSLPAFGPAREHQERAQSLGRAMLGLQQANDAYNALMLEAGRDAFVRFERKLGERSEPGRQLKSARALFDLWVDAAEEAYAEVALSVEFRQRYAALVDAQMRVRAGVQDAVERMTAQFGMPTRTEVDAAHRRIAQLERELRRLQRGSGATAASATAPAKTTRAKAAQADAAQPRTAQTQAAQPQAPQTQAADAAVQGRASEARASDGKRDASRSRSAKAKPSPQRPAKRSASVKPAAKQGASAPKPARTTAAKRKPAVDAKPRPAAARTKPAPSRRAAIAMPSTMSSAMPQAPVPLPAAKAGKTAAASRRRESAAATPARTRGS